MGARPWAGQQVDRRRVQVGETPVTLASGQESPFGIAIDSTSLYWVNLDTLGSVMKVTPK